MATNHVLPFFRQLKSKTSFDLSSPRAERIAFKRSGEKLPSGNRYDVMITYYAPWYKISFINLRNISKTKWKKVAKGKMKLSGEREMRVSVYKCEKEEISSQLQSIRY